MGDRQAERIVICAGGGNSSQRALTGKIFLKIMKGKAATGSEGSASFAGGLLFGEGYLSITPCRLISPFFFLMLQPPWAWDGKSGG